METSRVKVLFLASWYPSEEHPTLGNFIQKHAEAIAINNNPFVLYVCSSERVKNSKVERKTINNVDTTIVYYPKVTTKIPLLKHYLKYKRYIQSCYKGYESINEKFDLVHVNIAYPAGLFALILKQRFNLKYVLTEQWTGYLSFKNDFKKLNRLIKWQHQKIFKQASEVVVVSESLGQSLIEKGLTNNFKVIPNVVNPDYFYPKDSEKESSVPHFIHISTFDDQHKNISGMLRVFKKFEKEKKKFKLLLVAEGDKDHVVSFINKSGVDKKKVEINMNQTANQIGELIRRSNCLVLFSNYETFSVVLAEAWACNVPAVYAKCGGLTELNDKDLGFQITKKNEEELYSKICLLFSSEKLNLNPSKVGSSFYPNKIAIDFDKVYRDLF